MTNDLNRRFHQHQNGKNKTTRPYLTFELFYKESFETREDARKKEKYLKTGIGKEFLKKLST